jgi:hypothetical protein
LNLHNYNANSGTFSLIKKSNTLKAHNLYLDVKIEEFVIYEIYIPEIDENLLADLTESNIKRQRIDK